MLGSHIGQEMRGCVTLHGRIGRDDNFGNRFVPEALFQCRQAKFFLSADGMTGTSIHRLCQIADGSWRVAPP